MDDVAGVMATELRPGVWQLELRGVNAYLVEDGEDLVLVDTGTPFDADRLRSAVAATGHDLRSVDRVLVTHYDFDHVGGFGRLDLGGAPAYAATPDSDYLTKRRAPPLGNHKGALQRAFRVLLRAPEEVRTVEDGDQVGSFTVYRTPGHTPGHVAYVSEALSVAFVGDLVFESDGEFTASPWLLSYDTDAVNESIHDLADREPAVECVCPGHGVPFIRDGSVRLAELGQRIEDQPEQAVEEVTA
jgi:glyoxylase-like metal-dependent hydrolase (beta-lactamase superfamily II)